MTMAMTSTRRIPPFYRRVSADSPGILRRGLQAVSWAFSWVFAQTRHAPVDGYETAGVQCCGGGGDFGDASAAGCTPVRDTGPAFGVCLTVWSVFMGNWCPMGSSLHDLT